MSVKPTRQGHTHTHTREHNQFDQTSKTENTNLDVVFGFAKVIVEH